MLEQGIVHRLFQLSLWGQALTIRLHQELLMCGVHTAGIRYCGIDCIAIREAVNHENGVI
jgi:hypothetical protein